jgi:hypothetical protein
LGISLLDNFDRLNRLAPADRESKPSKVLLAGKVRKSAQEDTLNMA